MPRSTPGSEHKLFEPIHTRHLSHIDKIVLPKLVAWPTPSYYDTVKSTPDSVKSNQTKIVWPISSQLLPLKSGRTSRTYLVFTIIIMRFVCTSATCQHLKIIWIGENIKTASVICWSSNKHFDTKLTSWEVPSMLFIDTKLTSPGSSIHAFFTESRSSPI